MHEFYSPEIKIIQYAPWRIDYNREDFLQFASTHPNIQEKLIPERIIIDEKQKRAVVLLRSDFTLQDTGEVAVQRLSAHYLLGVDEKRTIKIKELLIFVQAPDPKQPNIDALFLKAWEKAKKSK
jgi:hypothetical protein